MHTELSESKKVATLAQGEEFSFEEFVELATWFHNYPAPGLLIGGYMVEEAKAHMPGDVLFDAVCETSWCLPDAIQLLTPCTIGNGWLRVSNMGVYALSLYDKFTGEGVRVSLDTAKVARWDTIHTWLMKSRPKPEQDSEQLRIDIEEAANSIFRVEQVQLKPQYVTKRSKGAIGICPVCSDAYPAFHGSICRSCAGDSPYMDRAVHSAPAPKCPEPKTVPVEVGVGSPVLHDMTRIVPGESKGVAFSKGHVVTPGDVCRLQQMGKFRLYVDQDAPEGFIHENDAAKAFAEAMSGDSVVLQGEPCEGRVNMLADQDGILVVREPLLEAFNAVPEVMAASRHSYSLVRKGRRVAATRAIPLFLDKHLFERAMSVIGDTPLFSVHALRKAQVGLLITGNEVFKGLVEDRFGEVVEAKLKTFGGSVLESFICPDDDQEIATAAKSLEGMGCDLIVTTAGLSVDPDDVTRKGLVEAGLTDMLYGMPVLPGAMTLVGRLGKARVLGVPACALFHKTTSLDILLPRLLADLPITRADLAKLGNGGMCMECSICTYPKCPFGR